VQVTYSVLLEESPECRTDTEDEAEVGRLLETLATPVPPPAPRALIAHDWLGLERRHIIDHMSDRSAVDLQSLREVQVVAGHCTEGSFGSVCQVLGGVEPRPVEVVPDDHAFGAADAGDIALGRGVPASLQQSAVVRELQQVAQVPPRVEFRIDAGRTGEGFIQVRDER